MKHLSRRFLLGAIAAAASLPVAAQAPAASDYPNHAVKIIVAYPPGQSTDILTRYFAQKLTQAMGQTFFVENRAGASGNIGTAAAAKATPDGYTLIMGTSGTHAMNPSLYEKPGFDPDKDFDPMVMTALIPMAVSVNPSSGINSLTELIAMARSKPDKVDTAIPSVTAQLVLEMMKERNVPLFGVKYKGSADAMTATLGGHVTVLIDTVAATRTQLGKIKPLAVTIGNQMASMPGVKTAEEQGLPGFQVAAWNALMAPKGVPLEIRAKLTAEMRKILELPETQKTLADFGFERTPDRTPAEIETWMRDERRSYAQTIKAAQMKVD